MPNGEILTQVRAYAGQAGEKAHEYSPLLGQAKGWIVDTFGQNGLYAAYIVGAVLGLFLLAKLAKLTFATVKYLVVPALGLALIGSFVLPYSFYYLLPITMTGCSMLLLFKG